MALDELERVRRKVIAGDALTDSELEVLERAATRERSISLRLAVAHAWMNAEQDRRALELLRTLCGERPRDPNVRMALARALLGLDRYADAELELKEALALRPGDPEALKALAALSMRHGEVSRAKALVSDALLRDPFDGEARVLKEELESAASAPVLIQSRQAAASLADFTDTLLTQLRARKVRHLMRGKDLLLRLPGREVARVDLPSLYAQYVDRGVALQPGVDSAIAELTSIQSRLPGTREDLLARVLPVLRPPEFSETATAATHREGPAGLLIYYVLEDPEFVRYVPPGALESVHVGIEAVDSAAWSNLARTAVEPMRVSFTAAGELAQTADVGGLIALATGDGHDAARLLTEPQRALIDDLLGAGPWWVHLGRRELAVVARATESIDRLRSLPIAPDGIPGVFRLTRDGSLHAEP